MSLRLILQFAIFVMAGVISLHASTALAATSEAQCAIRWSQMSKTRDKSWLSDFLRKANCGTSKVAGTARARLTMLSKPDVPPPPPSLPSEKPSEVRKSILTVSSLEKKFIAAPAFVFGNDDTSKFSAQEAATGVAQFIRNSNFERNPIFTTDEIGMFYGNLDLVSTYEKQESVYGYFNYLISWRGAILFFSNRESAAKFFSNPEKYMPAYGGHCALFLARDNHLNGGPSARVYKGKMYIFINNSFRLTWDNRKDQYILQGDKRWNSLPLSRLIIFPGTNFTAMVRDALKK